MRPIFAPELINGVFGDPALIIDCKFVRRALLFDIGDVARLATRKLLRVSDVFVSHAHMDHFAGFDRLLRVCLGRAKGVRMYGPPQFLDRIEHKLAAYTWNLVQNYAADFTVTAHELLPDSRVRSARFRSRSRFVREPAGEIAVRDGVLLMEPELRVRATFIDHETPCLAFTLEESTHINIWKSRLAELGLPTGPWLQDLKAAVRGGASDDAAIRATWHDRHGSHVRDVPLGELKARVVKLVPGQKICYVADAAWSDANAQRIVGRRFCTRTSSAPMTAFILPRARQANSPALRVRCLRFPFTSRRATWTASSSCARNSTRRSGVRRLPHGPPCHDRDRRVAG
jgi:ribonuclease Z